MTERVIEWKVSGERVSGRTGQWAIETVSEGVGERKSWWVTNMVTYAVNAIRIHSISIKCTSEWVSEWKSQRWMSQNNSMSERVGERESQWVEESAGPKVCEWKRHKCGYLRRMCHTGSFYLYHVHHSQTWARCPRRPYDLRGKCLVTYSCLNYL